MSRYVDLACRQCAARAGFHLNHGDERLLDVWKNRKPLQALVDTILRRSMQFEIESGPVWIGFVIFAQEHDAHDVRILDEYGRWDDRCQNSANCETCGVRHNCQLDKDHEGKHSRTRP